MMRSCGCALSNFDQISQIQNSDGHIYNLSLLHIISLVFYFYRENRGYSLSRYQNERERKKI